MLITSTAPLPNVTLLRTAAAASGCTFLCCALLLQLSASQDQVATLQNLVQQLMDKQQHLEQKKQQLQDTSEQQQADVDRTSRLLHGEIAPISLGLVRTFK